VGRETLQKELPNGQWYKGEGDNLQVSLESQKQRVRRFNLFTILAEVARESGKSKISRIFDMPIEIQRLKSDIENKAQLAQGILDNLDEVDIVNIDTDEYYQKLKDELGDFSNPFSSEICDP